MRVGALLLLSLSASAAPAPGLQAALDAEEGWTLLDTDDGVRVYAKAIPGEPIKAFKGVLELDAGVDAALLARLIGDVGNHDRVSTALAESTVVTVGAEGVVYFQVTRDSRLMPVSQRYWINTSVEQIGPGGHYRRAWSSVDPDSQPDARAQVQSRYPEAIPVRATCGSWELQPLDDGRYLLTYRTLSHPGGDVPEGLYERISGARVAGNMLEFVDAARGG